MQVLWKRDNARFARKLVLKGGSMTTVNCYLEECIYCKDNICTKDTITLAEEHYGIGGCDDGWEFPEEEDDD
jgi:hypothetical protein